MELDAHFNLESKNSENDNKNLGRDNLICDCINCNFLTLSKPLFSNPNCLDHCFKILYSLKNKEINEIKINRRINYYILNKQNIQILNELMETIISFKNNLFKANISNFVLDNTCDKYKNCLKRINNFINNTFGKDLTNIPIFKDPIKTFKEIDLEIKINIRQKTMQKCVSCLKEYVKFLNLVKKGLENTMFFKNYSIYKNKIKDYNTHQIYELILGEIFESQEIKDTNEINYSYSSRNKVSEYNIFPFHVNIFEDNNSIENLFEVVPQYNDEEIRKILVWIENKLENIDLNIFMEDLLSLNESLAHKIKLIESLLLDNFDNLDANRRQFVILYATFKTTGFLFLFPFLIDDDIEEIFIDRPNTEIYIDHRKYGRCKTNIVLSEDEIKRFITITRIECNLPLDETHPSIKAEIITSFFQIRATIIISPLSTDGYILIIRKMRKKEFSIIELIKNRTISIEAAAYLLFNLYHKRNIVVIGPPGSGKTTLINSLDILTPTHWRKMYIEDVIESIDQSNIFQHQVRISVRPSSVDDIEFYSKEFQVRECLHRTPDMIYLGEMITSSSINAFFFLLKVGLRCGLSTSHGETPELVIKRWMIEDNISINSIKDLDLIVQLARVNDVNQIKRRVINISELKFNEFNDFEIISFFKRDADKDILQNLYGPLERIYKESPVIEKIKKANIEPLNFEDFYNEIIFLIDLLQNLIDYNLKDNIILNKILNKFWVLKRKNCESDWLKIKEMLIKFIFKLKNGSYQ
ncbi:MAG: ATPase, T2SS/T4P/T4SS family [Candidatus Helarchaeota archaeon]